MLRAGKEEIVFLKDLVVEEDDKEEENSEGLEIEMMRMDGRKKKE